LTCIDNTNNARCYDKRFRKATYRRLAVVQDEQQRTDGNDSINDNASPEEQHITSNSVIDDCSQPNPDDPSAA
jgi:hypothetical protein